MKEDKREKRKEKRAEDPLQEVIKIILKSQAQCCVRAKIKLDELEKNDK